jgi:hypothetical protein
VSRLSGLSALLRQAAHAVRQSPRAQTRVCSAMGFCVYFMKCTVPTWMACPVLGSNPCTPDMCTSRVPALPWQGAKLRPAQSGPMHGGVARHVIGLYQPDQPCYAHM